MLRELTAGDVFGEMAIFDRKPGSATVQAKGTAQVLTLDKRAFLRGVHEDPSLAYRVLLEMSRWIRSLTEELARRERQVPLIETGAGRATIMGFDYDHAAHPSPPSRIYHWAKALLNRTYWATIPSGRF